MSPGLVIAGAGLAAQRCCETLRAAGDARRITIIGDERHRPYDRPPLSKAALAAPTEVSFRPASWYAEQCIELRLGRAVAGLDAARRHVVVAGGERVRYDDLLIATGARPRTLPLLSRFANVQALRTRDDAERLRAALAAGGPLAVVGAGLIGLEVAATATAAGIPVTVVEAAARPLTGVLGPATALWLAARHVAAGADLRLGVTVAGTIGRETVTALVLSDGTRVSCAHALVGIGVAPALEWVAGSGLDPRGVATDPQGRTALPHVFAAGDAAGGGHWEAAAHAGSAVAGALMGHPARRARPASFWTDQHGTRLVCIGDPRDARERHAPPHRAPFALDHLRDGRLVAVVLADPTPAALRDARRRLSTPIPATARTAA